MSGRFPPKTVSPTHPANGVSPELFRRQRFLRRLAVYRPLGVLASIWVVFLAIALLAYGQLLRTAPEPEGTQSSKPGTYPHERLNDRSDNAVPNAESSATDESAAADGPVEIPQGDRVEGEVQTIDTGINLWTLLALVGTCALGCWLLSVQLKSPPKPRKIRKKKPVSAQGAPPQRSAPNRPTRQLPVAAKPKSPAAPQKLAPYDPNQPLIKAAATHQTSPSPQTPSQPQVASEPSSDVSVVSEEFQHRLDWPEDSLVNTADVRQRRSLSSFL